MRFSFTKFSAALLTLVLFTGILARAISPGHGSPGAAPRHRQPSRPAHPPGAQKTPRLRARGGLSPQAVARPRFGVGGSTMRVAHPRPPVFTIELNEGTTRRGEGTLQFVERCCPHVASFALAVGLASACNEASIYGMLVVLTSAICVAVNVRVGIEPLARPNQPVICAVVRVFELGYPAKTADRRRNTSSARFAVSGMSSKTVRSSQFGSRSTVE